MPRKAPIRFLVSLGFVFAALTSAQSPSSSSMPVKPSASHTASSLPASTPPATPTPQPLTPSQQQPKHAQVTYANGILSISADNASLNQILHQISHDTGIKITGGVVDERVFGQYGPAPSIQTLSALLDGTGTNVLFLNRDGGTPAELVLTPREGGRTPPNPSATTDESTDSQEPQPGPEPTPPTAEESAPSSSTPPVETPATPPAAASPASGSQADPGNTVRTPQQIYDQLQHLRQQQQQPAPQ